MFTAEPMEGDLTQAVGSPVLADLTGDGVAKILVATADGRLVAVAEMGRRVEHLILEIGLPASYSAEDPPP